MSKAQTADRLDSAGPEGDDLEMRVRKLEKINAALMRRVERDMDFSGNGFSLFQTAIVLESQVKSRTEDLRRTLDELSNANVHLQQARDEAEAAKQNLTTAIESVTEGFALFDVSERLIMCNRPFRTLMPDVGKDMVPGLTFPQVAALFARSDYLVLDREQTREQWREKRIRLFRRPHGSFIQQVADDRWIQVSNRRTETGGTVIFQTDISDLIRLERERRERQLDEQSQLLQATLDHLLQGICVFDDGATLVGWNDRFRTMLGLPFNLVKQRISFGQIANYIARTSVITSQREAQRLADWVEKRDTERSLRVEFLRSDGAILEANCTLMPDGGFVASFTDVTAERKAREALREAKQTLEQRVVERTAELTDLNQTLRREIAERLAIEQELIKAKETAEEANRSKTRFLAAASHDLLQPLNAARLFLSSLSETQGTDEQHKLIEKLDVAFMSVEELLETLLYISRLDAGAIETNVQDFALHRIFDALETEFRPLAQQKGLDLRFVTTSAVVRSDPKYLRRIVQNLLSNAIRYTREGTVLVGVRRRGDNAVIEVRDTGPGIPQEHMPRIFEEFQRFHGAGERQRHAMGLGLAIVQRAARLLSHRIGVESVSGVGSVFSVEVPLSSGAPAFQEEERGEADTPAADLSNSIVLIIENDIDILEGMVGLLCQWGCQPIPTMSAAEAHETIERMGRLPAVVVADYHLDDETGLDAIRGIRAEWQHDVPALIVTADRSSDLQAALEAEGIELLSKPVKPALLQRVIGKLRPS